MDRPRVRPTAESWAIGRRHSTNQPTKGRHQPNLSPCHNPASRYSPTCRSLPFHKPGTSQSMYISPHRHISSRPTVAIRRPTSGNQGTLCGGTWDGFGFLSLTLNSVAGTSESRPRMSSPSHHPMRTRGLESCFPYSSLHDSSIA